MLNNDQIDVLKQIVIQAGKQVLNIKNKQINVFSKNDKSPVTLADIQSNRIICDTLKKKIGNIPIVSEENTYRKINNSFFLIDPLDGTKEFISGESDFTVNIALIKDNEPIYGFIYAPVNQELYWNNSEGSFFSSKKKESRIFCRGNIKLKDFEISSSHKDKKTENFINSFSYKKTNHTGSSLKLCKLASGISNIYPRFGTTMEWDIAAGHSILRKAGGDIFVNSKQTLTYGKKDFKNPNFIAIGSKSHSKELIKRFLKYQKINVYENTQL